MRKKLALLFSAMLVAATGYGQNAVMVNKSNGVITYPNNFWTANALQGRTGLGLGSAATNASTSFQPSSSVLSNLTSSNAVNLTNLRASNIVGAVGLASNIVGVAAITNGGTGATNAEGARSALGMPLSILTNTDVLTFRGSLFPEYSPFTGGNEVSMTEDTVSAPVVESKVNVTFGAPNSAGVLVLRSPDSTDTTNYTATIMYSDGVAGGYGQFTAPTNNSNVTILLPPQSGQLALVTLGNVGTNSGVARTNIGLSATWLTNTNVTNFRSDIGLSLTALTNTNTANFRSAVGLGLTALTNTNITNFRSDIGLGHITAGLDSSSIGSGEIKTGYRTTGIGVTGGYIDTRGLDEYGGNIDTHGSTVSAGGNIYTYGGTNADHQGGSIITADGGGGIDTRGTGSIEFGINGTRTSLTGTATTNRSISLPNSDGILVAVNTNGVVVSPTNFWQVAPIQTLVQTFAPNVSSNSYGTNARNLYVYSMATSISGVTNTVVLPTNSATFDGDAVTITHKGTTSSITAVRQAGSATNFTTISNEDESVKFIREGGQWTFYHNISFVEPIRFADGNIEDNKAASRTNLGLGFAALTNTNTTNFQAAIFNTNTNVSNGGSFASLVTWMEVNVITNGVPTSFRIPLFK